MIRRMVATLFAVLIVGSWTSAQAQTAPRLSWSAGQVLLYRVELTAVTSEQVGESKSETKNVLKVTKRWQVKSVDAAGVATLALSLTAMYQERTLSTGDVLKYDSANPDKSTPQLKAALEKYINAPLATIRVDAFGRVVEVKESKSPASSYENELPFVAVLPSAALTAGAKWDRAYQITLSPPLGTGEKYEAVQRYACKSVTADQATWTLTTQLKAPPKAAGDSVPLWQMLPTGEVTFDLKNGRLHAARLEVNQELKNHQGEGSVCRFRSTQTIQYAGER
jgi:hypothetical protein